MHSIPIKNIGECIMSGELSNKKIYTKKKGFTLVELIVVILIVAILAAIAIPAFIGFIDLAREKEYKNNAAKSLAATQSVLSTVYSDAGNGISSDMRESAKKLAVGDVTDITMFMVWTKAPLEYGVTKALPENIASYTVDRALYSQAGEFFVYNGTEWEKSDESTWNDAKNSVSTDFSRAIYMWPYDVRDPALPWNDIDDVNFASDEDRNVLKTATLILEEEKMDYVYFEKEGRNNNSGLSSINILFWKEGDVIKSTWTSINGTDFFKADDGNTYTLKNLNRYPFEGWEVAGNSAPALLSIADIRDYVYANTGNAFSFKIKLGEPSLDQINEVFVSKSGFMSAINSGSGIISGFVKHGQSEYDKKTVPAGAVRIDDDTVLDGYAFAWKEGNTLHWWSNAKTVYLPADCSSLFSGSAKVKEVNLSGFDLKYVTTMNGMFSGNGNVTDVVSLGDGTSANLTDVGAMFMNCANLQSADISSLKSDSISNVKEMFSGCKELTGITFDAGFDTKAAKDFSKMFYGCAKVTQINAASLDTSSAETFESMFEGCASLAVLNVGGWDTTKVTTLKNTFKDCKKIQNLNLSDWDFSHVTTLESTFEGMTAVQTIDVSTNGFSLVRCKDMSAAFKNCSSLAVLDTKSISTTGTLTSMKETFRGCEKLTSIEFKSSLSTYDVTDMSYLFCDCRSLTEIKGLEYFHTSKVTDFGYMFANDIAIAEIDISTFETKAGTNFEGMFFVEDGLNGRLAKVYASPRFDVAASLSGTLMFKNNILVGSRATSFVENRNNNVANYDSALFARVDGWDGEEGYFTAKLHEVYISKSKFQSVLTSSVTRIEKVQTSAHTVAEIQYEDGVTSIKDTGNGKNTSFYVFAWVEGNTLKWWTDADIAYLPDNCNDLLSNRKNQFTEFDFTGFDVTKVKNINGMFSNNANLETITFGNMFYADSITTMENMFNGCRKLSSADFENIKTGKGKITSMKNTFLNCEKLTAADLGGIEVSNVKDFEGTFNGCKMLATLNISDWQNESATTVRYMFNNCRELTELDISGLKFKSIKYASHTFADCVKLEKIYVSSEYVLTTNVTSNDTFINNNALSGQNGTSFATVGNRTVYYAWPDGKDSRPGYFTEKQ